MSEKIKWHTFEPQERIKSLQFITYWEGGNSKSYCLANNDSADDHFQENSDNVRMNYFDRWKK